MMRWLISILLLVLIALSAAILFRDTLLLQVATIAGGAPPPLLPATTELPQTRWHDDYFTIDALAPGTFAIGEPRYPQQNYSYLLLGSQRALLFDAGPGLRDIRAVVATLTELPVLFLPSHFHYDHVGNGLDFAQRAVVDLPHLRARAQGNRLSLTALEHLGSAEGFEVPSWEVDEWLAPGTSVDLGGRRVRVLHTPGHSKESISVFDERSNLLFTGDFVYEGDLYAFTPGASLKDYLEGARTLLEDTARPTAYYGAHRAQPPGPPRLEREDLLVLQQVLEQIRSGALRGEGLWPVRYPVNERMSLLAEPALLQDW
ncbi:MAG: MBL fold metallo-hydrolase [Pseudomonadota bacterium]